MPLVTSEKMLKDARNGGYAVAAFNIENMEMTKAIVSGAEELNAPVILQVSQSTSKYGSLETYVAMVAVEAAKAKIPVALHLDHGESFEIAEAAINAGFTAVMIDGSKLSYEENLDLTKRVVDLAKTKGVVVEGELGKVGGKAGDVIHDLFTVLCLTHPEVIEEERRLCCELQTDEEHYGQTKAVEGTPNVRAIMKINHRKLTRAWLKTLMSDKHELIDEVFPEA